MRLNIRGLKNSKEFGDCFGWVYAVPVFGRKVTRPIRLLSVVVAPTPNDLHP